MKYHLVTTTNSAGWEQYGRRMAQSVMDRWTGKASLTVYAEGFEPDVPGVALRTLPAWLDEFKATHPEPSAHGKSGTVYDYRRDAVKFAHKVAAVTDFGLSLSDGVMIWLDADTFTHSDVTDGWLRELFPEPAYIAWLERKNVYPECGFVMYRVAHHAHRQIMEGFRDLYTGGGLFKLRETHDCMALQDVVTRAFRDHRIPAPVSLSGHRGERSMHPFAVGPLSKCLDHFKGARKDKGRTPPSERAMFVRDGHPYWAG